MAIENIAEDTSPWAIIIAVAPAHPHRVLVIRPEIKIAIWPTEEYAIKDFISVCRKQIILVIKAPHMEILINKGATSLFIKKNM